MGLFNRKTDTATTATLDVDPALAALTGDYTIDPAHSSIGFTVRHAMVTNVRGSFGDFSGSLKLNGTDPHHSTAEIDVKIASIDTGIADRDAHLRTGDFFEAETHPTIDFVSTGVRVEDGDFKVDGDLTIRGITKPVTFDFDFGGFGGDPFGNYKGGATAKTVINREDFGLAYNAALETGGVLLGDKVTITLELQAALEQ
jgi:polyisoprenoid-binding protein YceI